MNKTKRCYLGTHPDSEEYVAFVAYSTKEALGYARNYEGFIQCENPFINTRVNWEQGVNVDDQPVGELDLVVGLKLDLYCHVWGVECDVCGRASDEVNPAHYIDDQVMCEECEDAFLNIKQPNEA